MKCIGCDEKIVLTNKMVNAEVKSNLVACLKCGIVNKFDNVEKKVVD